MSDYKEFLEKRLDEGKVPSDIGKLLPASTKILSVDDIDGFLDKETIVSVGDIELTPITLSKLSKNPNFIIATTKKDYSGFKNSKGNLMLIFKKPK